MAATSSCVSTPMTDCFHQVTGCCQIGSGASIHAGMRDELSGLLAIRKSMRIRASRRIQVVCRRPQKSMSIETALY